ncbi:ABC transporter ATP-binding protein [Agrococcus versicolor]|uniref:ABC transporter ATP-binding protein n=1 Tax=Agrococcus versicolor TaxID=501482 RepID=UPI0031DCAE8E
MPAPVEQVPVEQVPVEQVPVEPVPVEQVPVEQVPVEQVPVEQVPVEPEPVEEPARFTEAAPEPEPTIEPEPESITEPEPEPIVEPEPLDRAMPEPQPESQAQPESTAVGEAVAPSAPAVSEPILPEPTDADEPVEVVIVQSDPDARSTIARREPATDDARDDLRDDLDASPSRTPGTTASTTDGAPAVVLSLDGVTRRFGATVAIDDVHLVVRAGECHGVVGPNGAGKSTTLSIAAGLMRPTSGSVEVHGQDVRARGVQAQLGVVPDRMRLFDRLTGRQLLVHAALLRRVPRKDAITRAATLLERFELTADADRLVADYSIGMQQLVGIAAALIHAPRVVVLDEPFESIDPVSTDVILSVLGDLRRRGGAVVLTSHDMRLVERACDHVVVLQDGVVRASGSVDDVRDGLSLEDRFARIVGASPAQELPWLSPSRD